MTGRDWRDATREEYDTAAPPAPLFDATPAMAAPPVDACGTGDLLELLGGEA